MKKNERKPGASGRERTRTRKARPGAASSAAAEATVKPGDGIERYTGESPYTFKRPSPGADEEME